MSRCKKEETPQQREARLARQRAYEARRKEKDLEGWKKANQESAKRYRERNPEKAKQASKNWHDKNVSRVYEKRAENRKKNHLLWLYREAKARARKRNVEFDIQYEDIPERGEKCPLLGVPFDEPTGNATPYRASLDRVDPKKGYVKGNVWWVSYRANLIKNDGTAEEHMMIAIAMMEKLKASQRNG